MFLVSSTFLILNFVGQSLGIGHKYFPYKIANRLKQFSGTVKANNFKFGMKMDGSEY